MHSADLALRNRTRLLAGSSPVRKRLYTRYYWRMEVAPRSPVFAIGLEGWLRDREVPVVGSACL